MAINLEQKKAIVAEVSQVAKDAISAVVADYRGIDVASLTSLRAKARENNVYLKVVRNTLAKRAIKDTDFECLEGALVGPIIFGFAQNEPGAAAKLFKDFAKDNDKLVVKALSVAGTYYDASDLDRVASLPSKDEALSMLAGALLAPVTKLARTLSEPHASLARALQNYAENKE